MPRSVWERTLNEVKQQAWVMQFYFQGEPLLNKDLPLMIREAHDAGLYTIVSTNAQAMTPDMAHALVTAGLDRIIISMDGLTDKTYNAYRIGASLEKTKAALRYLRESKIKNQKSKIKNQKSKIKNFNRTASSTIKIQRTRMVRVQAAVQSARGRYPDLQDCATIRLRERPFPDAYRPQVQPVYTRTGR